MPWDLVLLAVGLTLLYFGAEYMVEGASKLALGLGISPLVIGLTVVAFGTSAPELLVSVSAGIQGSPEVAYGNIVGSNICNIALILGAAALIRPLHVDQNSLRHDYPVVFFSSGALCLMAWLTLAVDGWVAHLGGGLLLTGLIMYTGFNLRRAREAMKERREAVAAAKADGTHEEEEEDSRTRDIIYVVGGITGLAIGGPILVEAAINIAKSMGVSDFVIGVSIIAFGTSLPELATSVVAALKGESDIVIGNVLGSNIFNVMLVIGLVSLLFGMPADEEARQALSFDYPIMIGLTFLLYPLMRTGFVIGRGKAVFLLLFYAGYMVALFVVREPPANASVPETAAVCEVLGVEADKEACESGMEEVQSAVGEEIWTELVGCVEEQVAAGKKTAAVCMTSPAKEKLGDSEVGKFLSKQLSALPDR